MSPGPHALLVAVMLLFASGNAVAADAIDAVGTNPAPVTTPATPANPEPESESSETDQVVAEVEVGELSGTVGIQYRPRLEADSRGFGSSETDFKASHRARLNIGLVRGSWQVQLAPQHVLGWGTEAGSLATSSGDFDMHTVYLEGPMGDARFRIGRQEIVVGDQRLVGSVNWTQQGRSFDGGLVNATSGPHSHHWFAVHLDEGGLHDAVFLGGHANVAVSKLKLVPVGLLQLDGRSDLLRSTIGSQLVWTAEQIGLELSGYGQFGRVDPSQSIVAGMVAGRLNWTTSTIALSTGADWLSGDTNSSDSEINSFDTLYATNHKFYGSMDYFLNIPVHTAGLGLIDAVIDVELETGMRLKPRVAAHYFAAGANPGAGDRTFGSELDVSAAIPINPFVKLVGGYSFFVAGKGMVDIGRAAGSGDVSHWAWLMLDTNFNYGFSK